MKPKILPYPYTKEDNVVDDYHGVKVTDPYRWLENDNSPETAAWVNAQNEVTQDYLNRIPYRDRLKKRLEQLWDYRKEGTPSKHGDWYYFVRNEGLQNQGVVYRSKALEGEAEIFIDPNAFSKDGIVALGGMFFSEDGIYCAYTLSQAGSDWTEIKLMETASRRILKDRIRWVKFSGASWSADSGGFYYSAYTPPAEGNEYSGLNSGQKVFFHRIGDDQGNDTLVYEDTEHPLRYLHGHESDDGKYIIINCSEGTHGTELLYRRTERVDEPFRILRPGFEYDYSVIRCENDKALVFTDLGAPNYRLIAVDMSDSRAGVSDIIPENEANTLESISAIGSCLIATYLENATNKVMQFDISGNFVREIDIPAPGTVTGFENRKEAGETFYAVTSYAVPPTVYRYDPESGVSKLYHRPRVDFDPDLYMTEQVFFASKDGTQVPMFIVRRKDLLLNGKNTAQMYGYGGFNISYAPTFNPSVIMLLEQGGIYVHVTLRGGGEYGEKWHRAGMLERKQNVFDDFIAAAEYLIKHKYTSPGKLAISGGSNGGLLVGACMLQRPDLFAVAIPQVGVLDMLRYHLFTIGWGWGVEYGRSDDPRQFEYLYRYSPLHNVVDDRCYPSTLIVTADHDDRVVPAHSFKFAARLQKAQGCRHPVLIRIDSNAGHGSGKPTSKRIEEAADIYAFLFENTGTKVKF